MRVLVNTSVWSLALRRQPHAQTSGLVAELASLIEDHRVSRCRAKGVQGSNTDFLICAVAARRELSIFTTDEDFEHFAKVLPITLHQPSA